MVVLQKAAESLLTFDVSTRLPNFLPRLDDLVAEPLVVSFSMEMTQVSVDGSSQRRLAEEDHSLQAFGLERAEKPLEVWI